MSLRLHLFIILHFLLASCHPNYVKEKEQFSHHNLKETAEQPKLLEAVNAYKTKVDAETEKTIVSAVDELTKDGDETTIGNFVCDALLYAGEEKFKGEKADMVILNRGGLRANLSKGEIKVKHIFELMPFENEMVMIKIKGDQLTRFFELLKEKQHPFLGAKVRIRKNEVTALIAGEEIDRNRDYRIVTSDYLANGGDNFTFFGGAEIRNANLKIRDAIIEYCKYLNANGQVLKPYKDGRLEISK